jgi:hypothetical protein
MQDATVQSIPQTSQVPAAVAPSSYVVPSYQAAPAAPVGQPAPYQVGTSYPQAVPQAAPNYQSNPSQYAPQSQSETTGNPWESAFNKVVGLLSSPVQSPFQGQPSAPTTYSPANYGQANGQGTYQSVPQTSQANQTYSPNYSQTSSTASAETNGQSLSQMVADSLNLSNESRFVVNNYGWEAPAILNQYALNLEGMLDSAVAWGQQAQGLLTGYANFAVNEHQENLAYNEILTNPDVLSDYTLQFFGPEGPCPVYESETELETPGYRTAPVDAMNAYMPAPPSATAPQRPENFWGSFKQQMDMDPANAWRLLNQAQPQVVANKLFVME